MKLGWDRWGEFRMPSRRFLVGMPGPPQKLRLGTLLYSPCGGSARISLFAQLVCAGDRSQS